MKVDCKIVPADKTPDGAYKFVISDMINAKRQTINADTLDGVIAEARRLAKESGLEHCCVSLTVPNGFRKPRGFDAAARTVQFITNEMETA